MGGFLYYVPGRSSLDAKSARKAGMGYALRRGHGVTFGQMSPGPDDGAGAICRIDGGPGAHIGSADRAEWIDCGGFWVGMVPSDPPGPSDLLRADVVQGDDILLDDGNYWHIPIARRFDGTTALPRKIKWENGDWILGDVVAFHRKLFQGAMDAFDGMIGSEDCEIVAELDLISAAVSANYRVGPAEIGLLGLLTTDNRNEILRVLVDIEALLEATLKKTEARSGEAAESEEPSSKHGPEAA